LPDPTDSPTQGQLVACAVTLVECLSGLDGQLEGAPTEGDGELVEETDLAEQDLPGSGSPLAEEPDLRPPFPTRLARLRSKPERHVSRMHQSRLPADLQRGRIVAIRCHPDLSGNTGRGKDPLRARVDERMEGCLLRPVRPLGCIAPLVGSSWYGKNQGKGRRSANAGATRGQPVRLRAPALSEPGGRWRRGSAWSATA